MERAIVRHWFKERTDTSAASALLDGAADIFERGGRKPVAEVDEETVRSLHAKIGELAVSNDFFVTKAQAVDRQVMRHWNAIGPRDNAERDD